MYSIHLSISRWEKQFLVLEAVFQPHLGWKWTLTASRGLRPLEAIKSFISCPCEAGKQPLIPKMVFLIGKMTNEWSKVLFPKKNSFCGNCSRKYGNCHFGNFQKWEEIVLYFIHLSFSQCRKQFLVWVVVFQCHKGRKWKIWQPQVAVRPREAVNVHFQPKWGWKTATSTKNCFCHW